MSTPFLNKELHVAWSQLTPERARTEIRSAIESAKNAVAAICVVQEPTYDNTFAALEASGTELMRGWQRLSHLQSVMDSPELRDVVNELMPEVVIYSSSVTLNPQLYAVLKKAAAQPWVAELSAVKQRFISETLADFRENGAELSNEQKVRYAELTTKLAQLSQTFGEDVLDSTNAWEYITTDAAELEGLPASALAAAQADALSKGHGTAEAPAWRFTLQFTSVQPVLTFVENEGLRSRIWHAMNEKGTGKYDTQSLIHEIMALRAEKAAMLGYERYSDYVTSRRMAGSGSNALSFINRLHERVKAPFLAEQEEIRRFASGFRLFAMNVEQITGKRVRES